MTKHVFGVYGTEPGELRAPAAAAAAPEAPVVAEHSGPASVAGYSVVHGRDGEPEWALLVCETPAGTRTYARMADRDRCARAEREELCGTTVELWTEDADGPMGPIRRNIVEQ